MAQPRTRHDEMREACEKYHADHPEVWAMFVKFTLSRIDNNFKHYGAKAIFERIRWESAAGADGLIEFKIGNNHPAFYARRFMQMYPEHTGFFRLRKQTSKSAPALERGELGPDDYEYTTTQGR